MSSSSEDGSTSSAWPPPPPSGDSSASPPPPPASDGSSSSAASSPPPPPPSDGSVSTSPPPHSSGNLSSPPPPSSGDNSSSSASPPENTQSGGNDNGGNNNGDNNGRSPRSSRDSKGDSDTALDRSSKDSMKELSSPSSRDNNQKAVVAAVAASAALLLIIMILLCTCWFRKRSRRRPQGYRENPHSQYASNDYYNNNNWHHNDDPSKMTPPPVPGGGMSSDHSWMPPPPMSSSDMSSGYSGPHGGGMPPHPGMAMGYNQGSFTYNDLATATNNFSQANLLGQGGFGYVHKGVLPNGKEVAVKSLKPNSGQGEREFQAEVEIISRVHHRHLVSLVGYCMAGAQRMLVYEFVPNGTLEYHLYGADRSPMEWSTRLKIALGSAKGFAYLHEDCNPRIIHRDIKTANILIDMQFEAKVADFGLAKLSSDTNTHVSTRIMGTFGYLAPEYASTGKLTEKSDVYSFGIVLLELITGRRPIDINRDDDDDTLVDWARPILMRVQEGGSFDELVDPRLGKNYNPQEMLRMVHCAAASIRHSARRRPKMSKLVRVLEGDVSLEDLNEGIKGMPSATNLVSGVGSHVLSSQEFSSDEHVSHPNATPPPPNLPRPPN